MLKTNGGGICDHEVGGGKTVIMCTAAYEMKRLGLANKPMIIGLKANVFDIADTFRKAYPTVMSVSAVQLPNACSPIAVTLPGRVTLVSAEQPEKAYFPIVVSPSGRVTLVSAAQSLKAASPIVWTPAGRVTLVSTAQFLKAYAPTLVTPASIFTFSIGFVAFSQGGRVVSVKSGMSPVPVMVRVLSAVV